MTIFAFTAQRVAEIRQRTGQVCCCLVLPSTEVREGTTRQFSRVVKHTWTDTEGQECARLEHESVQDVAANGDLKPARFTVLLVELVDVYAEKATPPLRVIDFAAARAGGFKTPTEMREEFASRHARSEFAKLVWFCLGDVRDKDRYLQRYISRGGDYTSLRIDAIDELPALSEAQLEELAAANRQKFDRQRADQSVAREELTLAQRVARIEAVGNALRREIKNEVRIITERAARGKKKLGA